MATLTKNVQFFTTGGLVGNFVPDPNCSYYTLTLIGGGGGGGSRGNVSCGAGGGGGGHVKVDMVGDYSFTYQIGEGGAGGNGGGGNGGSANSTVCHTFISASQGAATGLVRGNGGLGGGGSQQVGVGRVWGLGGRGGDTVFTLNQGFYGAYPNPGGANCGGDGEAGFVDLYHPTKGGGTFLFPGIGSSTDGGAGGGNGTGRGGGGGSFAFGDGAPGGTGILMIEQFIINV